MNKLFFIIGASGSGKTTIVKALEELNFSDYKVIYFDSIGVPSYTDMVEKYGNPENWQRTITHEWVKTIKEQFLTETHVILDGQTRPQFIKEACLDNHIVNYEIILFDCSDQERTERLIKRGHPELANQHMMDWAKYLREKCVDFSTIDNTCLNKQETLSRLIKALKI